MATNQKLPLNAPAAGYGSLAPAQQSMDPIGDSPFCVQRQINVIELFGVQGANNHLCYQGNTDKGPLVMTSFEESGCCDRICCHSAREATFSVHKGGDRTQDLFWKIKKKSFVTPLLYICIPAEAEVFDSGNAQIGHLMNPCACCKIKMHINDNMGKEKFAIEGSHLQLGSCCPCFADFNFKVTKDGNDVGTMTKLQIGCKEFCFGTTRIVVDVNGLSSEERGNFLASAILIDMVHFDNKSQNEAADV